MQHNLFNLYVTLQILIKYVSEEWVYFQILEWFGQEGTHRTTSTPLPWAGMLLQDADLKPGWYHCGCKLILLRKDSAVQQIPERVSSWVQSSKWGEIVMPERNFKRKKNAIGKKLAQKFTSSER